MSRQIIGFICLLALLALAIPASASVLSIGNAQVNAIGNTATADIVLDSVPDGFSGYNLSVSLTDPAIAEITGVSFPAWAGSNIDNSSFPADSVWIKAADIGGGTYGAIAPGATNVVLATLTFRGDAGGATPVTIAITKLNDDSGGNIVPTITPGTFMVLVPPVADFTATPLFGNAPLNVRFTDNSTGSPTAWAWDFNNDGTIDNITRNPEYTYGSAGSFTVNLTVTNTAGSDSEVKTAFINVTVPTVDWSITLTGARTVIVNKSQLEAIVNTGPNATFSNTNGLWQGIPLYYLVGAVDDADTGPWAFNNALATQGYTITVTAGDGFSRTFASGLVANSNNYVAANTLNGTVIPFTDPSNPAKLWWPLKLVGSGATGGSSVGNITSISLSGLPGIPAANFTASPLSGDAPLTVQFNDTSTGSPTAWAWDFNNDGTIDNNTPSPSYTYTANGMYTVNLTVSNAAGSTSLVKPNYISVSTLPPAPTVNFIGDNRTGPTPLLVHFTDQSTGNPTAWAWDFQNDGIIDSTDQNSSFTYTSPGIYQVNLTASNAGGSSFRLKGNYINVTGGTPGLPGTDFTSDVRTGTAPLTVHFNDTTTGDPFAWAWDFQNDGVIDSNSQNPVFTYLNPGNYQVNLTATNAAGNKSRLKASYITVNATPVTGFSTVVYTDPAPQHPGINVLVYSDQNDNTTHTIDLNYTAVLIALRNLHFNYTATNDFTIFNTQITSPPAGGWTLVIYNEELLTPPGGTYDNVRAHILGGGKALVSSGKIELNRTAPLWNALGVSPFRTIIFSTGPSLMYPVMPGHSLFNIPNRLANPIPFDGTQVGYRISGYNNWIVTGGDATAVTVTQMTYPVPIAGNITLVLGNSGRTVFNGILPGTMNVTASGHTKTTAIELWENEISYVVAQSSPLIASFTATPLSGDAPLTVQFTDTSNGNPTAWEWCFANGSLLCPFGSYNSTERNPVFTYTQPGVYNVSLRVTNGTSGNTMLKTNYITVNGTGPVTPALSVIPANATVPVSGTTDYQLVMNSLPNGLAGFNLTVSLDNPATGEITTLTLPSWVSINRTSALPADSITFNGVDLAKQVESGATNVVLATITVRGDVPGTTGIIVAIGQIDADGGGVVSPVVNNGQFTTYIPLVANFSATPLVGTRPLTVNFTDLSTGEPLPANWSWDFNGDGIVDSSARNPQFTYAAAGHYTVNLTVSNQFDSDTVSKSSLIWVKPNVMAFPGYTDMPTDPDGDELYEDTNGNGRLDFDDIVTYYQNMAWITANTEVGVLPYDLNGNGRIDYDDVVLLYYEVLAAP